jgi:hypothetical protein
MRTGTIKIRMKGLKLDYPTSLRILPKLDANFNIDGTAEVPAHFAEMLFGPGRTGVFELVEEKPDELKKTTKTGGQKVAPKPVQGVVEESTQDFVKSIG